MFFSVEPSGYHDITSLNEEDDDTPALEALPFRVCHVNAAPKKRKRRAAPAQRKESKKAKHDSSDSEEPDEAYQPSRRISSRPRKGVQRAVKEVSPWIYSISVEQTCDWDMPDEFEIPDMDLSVHSNNCGHT